MRAPLPPSPQGAFAVGGVGGGVAAGGVVAGAGADGSAAAGLAACTACCTSEDAGVGQMTYVGEGQGTYAVVTDYRYVGDGSGDFSPSASKTSTLPFILFGMVAAACFVAILFVTDISPPTTTTPAPVGPSGTCLLWGDPHLETFDHTFPNFFGEGEFWLVRSPMVHIQARYLATPFTNGLAATHEIAVGGAFLEGHTLIVGPMENGQITWDGVPVLQEFPSEFNAGGLGMVRYNGEGRLVDAAQSHLQQHIVHIDLPLGVHLQVMRWANHINVLIKMTPRVGGQDGHCGNFNGVASDDSTEQIEARMHGRVLIEDILFKTFAERHPSRHIPVLQECPPLTLKHAEEVCRSAQPQATDQLRRRCEFDVCFGGEQYAEQDGLAEANA